MAVLYSSFCLFAPKDREIKRRAPAPFGYGKERARERARERAKERDRDRKGGGPLQNKGQ